MMWYYLVSAGVLLTSFYLFRKAAGTMSIFKINVVSWIFYYHLFLSCFVGVNLSLMGVDHYLISLSSQRSLLMAYLSVSYVMVMMPLAMAIVQGVLIKRNIREKILTYFSEQLRPLQSKGDSFLVLYWLLLSAIALLATVYTYFRLETPPAVALLQGSDPADFARIRIQASREFPGNVYIKNLFSLLLAPLVSYVAYGYSQLFPRRPYKLWFWLTALIAILAITYSGEKAPIVKYFLTLSFIRSIINGGMSVKKLVFTICVALALIGVEYSLTTKDWSIAISSGPIGRMLLGQIAGLPLTFDVFPNLHPFLAGGSFPAWLTSIFGVEHARSARILMEIYNPGGTEAGIAGVINTLYIAEAWANFGWYGFLLAPVFVGIIVQLVYNLLLSLPKTPMFVAAMGWFFFGFPVTGGFTDFVWNVGWAFMFLVMVIGFHFRVVSVPPVRSRPTGSSTVVQPARQPHPQRTPRI